MEALSSLVAALSDLHPLLQGSVATALACLALSAWVAMGSLVVRHTAGDTVVTVAVSLLIGSGATAAAYAILTRFGIVDGAIWALSLVSLGTLIFRRRVTWTLLRGLADEYRAALADSLLLRVLAAPLVAVLWICAIAPPRDADVMRYHLAHIRQIISDGRWESIADYHYALPFGWTINYLPFERVHLPQAAALVNVGLWLIMLAGVLRLSRGPRTVPPAPWICLAFLSYPFVLRIFSSATPDAYAIFVVYTIAALLLTADASEIPRATLLGFVCWIGAQSRYQLLAAALAGTIVFLWIVWRNRSLRAAADFSKGAIAAVVLSLPFYLANLQAFGNPFWPLLVPQINGTHGYADRVVSVYSASLVGQYDLRAFGIHLIDLIMTPFLVPLALVIVILVPASLALPRGPYRRVAVFGTLLLVLWAMAQPRLFPKHVLLLLPLALLLAVATSRAHSPGPFARQVIERAFGAAIVLMLAASALFSLDYIRYSVTGDSAEYHRFTWYYPVYEWVNRSTPRDARFLVVAYSGHTYYLDRKYRRADPWLSGVVDWTHVFSESDLDEVLRHGGFDYVIYDDRDWSDFAGGSQMASVVKSAIHGGSLVPVHQFRERLYSSRFLRTFTETTVYVFRLRPMSPSPKGGTNLAPKAGTT